MLLRFSVANHRSFFESQELSLTASSLKDNEEGLISSSFSPSGYVLPSVVLYGSNAAGKSNLVSALRFIRWMVLDSHPKGRADWGVPRTSFKLAKSVEELPSSYDIDFVVDGVRYHYGFSANSEVYLSEWLYAFTDKRRQLLFERDSSQSIKFGRALRGRNRVIADLMRPNSLFLSAAIQNNHPELVKLGKFFSSIGFNASLAVDAESIANRFSKVDLDPRVIDFLAAMGTGVIGFNVSSKEISEEEKTVQSEIENFLRKLSENVAGSLEAVTRPNIDIYLLHEGVDGFSAYLDSWEESAGTRRLLVLLSAIYKALDEGSLVVIDEIEASLHTLICNSIIGMFSDKKMNPKGAQLIATTHNAKLLDNSLMRRDQFWFVRKDRVGRSKVFSLAEVKTRKGDDFEKSYLEGRYGAVPFE